MITSVGTHSYGRYTSLVGNAGFLNFKCAHSISNSASLLRAFMSKFHVIYRHFTLHLSARPLYDHPSYTQTTLSFFLSFNLNPNHDPGQNHFGSCTGIRTSLAGDTPTNLSNLSFLLTNLSILQTQLSHSYSYVLGSAPSPEVSPKELVALPVNQTSLSPS